MRFGGVGLKQEDFENKKVLFVKGGPKAEYAWDCGIAIGRYLRELKKGRIIGIKCDRCKRIVVPPRIFCEKCFKPMSDWVNLSDTGIVNTFSLCYVTWDMRRIEKPLIPAVIEIDGASKGMGIMHLLDEVEPKDVKIGMKVKACWKEQKEREGSILDIKYFKPEEKL